MSTPILHFDFFDRANQFRRAYRVLPNIGQPPEWPKYLLFYHAMELALKAYLIQQGVSEQVLKDEFGHDIKKLVDEAVKRGLPLPYGSQEMIAGLGGAPHRGGQANIAPHLRIRYPLGESVYSLGQFEPYMDHLFGAVASALGMSA
jgi:hypothetical protein